MSYKYKGKVYKTKKELAEDIGVSYHAINMRMSRGLSLKEAVEFKRKSGFTYKGKYYESYVDLLKKQNIPLTEGQFKHRLRIAGSIEKALKYKPPTFDVVYKKKKYESIRVLCDELGLNYSTIKNRVNARGLTLQQAVDLGIDRLSQEKRAAMDGKPKKAGAAKKKAVTKSAAKKPAAKKAATKKKVSKAPATAKKAAKKTATTKKAATKKKVAKKPVAKKAATGKKKTAAKATAKKTASKKTASKKKAVSKKKSAKK